MSEEEQEELLEEAKRRFPVGSRFYPIKVNGEISDCVYVAKDHYAYMHEGDIWIIADANIYSGQHNRWAQLVSLPESQQENYQIFCNNN